ncbi:hypothetical protein L1887_52928 [Cichorium endivia]|nr:hypothetical protein L1887_52928 [Cichorium endivia]
MRLSRTVQVLANWRPVCVLALAEFVRARVAHHRDAADGAVTTGREDLLALVAIVADEMRRLMVARTSLEQTRRHRGRLEEPLLAAVVAARRDEKRLTRHELDAANGAVVRFLDRVDEARAILSRAGAGGGGRLEVKDADVAGVGGDGDRVLLAVGAEGDGARRKTSSGMDGKEALIEADVVEKHVSVRKADGDDVDGGRLCEVDDGRRGRGRVGTRSREAELLGVVGVYERAGADVPECELAVDGADEDLVEVCGGMKDGAGDKGVGKVDAPDELGSADRPDKDVATIGGKSHDGVAEHEERGELCSLLFGCVRIGGGIGVTAVVVVLVHVPVGLVEGGHDVINGVVDGIDLAASKAVDLGARRSEDGVRAERDDERGDWCGKRGGDKEKRHPLCVPHGPAVAQAGDDIDVGRGGVFASKPGLKSERDVVADETECTEGRKEAVARDNLLGSCRCGRRGGGRGDIGIAGGTLASSFRVWLGVDSMLRRLDSGQKEAARAAAALPTTSHKISPHRTGSRASQAVQAGPQKKCSEKRSRCWAEEKREVEPNGTRKTEQAARVEFCASLLSGRRRERERVATRSTVEAVKCDRNALLCSHHHTQSGHRSSIIREKEPATMAPPKDPEIDAEAELASQLAADVAAAESSTKAKAAASSSSSSSTPAAERQPFSTLDLSEPTRKAIDTMGFKTMTEHALFGDADHQGARPRPHLAAPRTAVHQRARRPGCEHRVAPGAGVCRVRVGPTIPAAVHVPKEERGQEDHRVYELVQLGQVPLGSAQLYRRARAGSARQAEAAEAHQHVFRVLQCAVGNAAVHRPKDSGSKRKEVDAEGGEDDGDINPKRQQSDRRAYYRRNHQNGSGSKDHFRKSGANATRSSGSKQWSR